MIDEKLALEKSGTTVHTTTAWREWLGWFGSIMWFYSMINWYEYLMEGYSEANVYGFSLAFKLVFLLSIIGYGYRFGRDPNGLGQIAHYTAPIAFLLTIGFIFVPQPLGSALYVISPAFFAPALVRRVYGVIQTAKPGYTYTVYMLAVGAAFVPMNAFLDYFYYNDVPLTIAYAAVSVFALIAWAGVRRRIGVHDDAPGVSGVNLTKTMMCFLFILFLVACWLIKMKSIVDYTMEQFDYILYIPVYIILPGIYYVLFGYIGDKKRERPIVIGVFIAYLICLQLAFLLGDPTGTQNKVVIPLVILNHLAGNIIEYFSYIIPIYFFTYSKRPVFVASLGVASYLAMRTVRWTLDPLLPEASHIVDLTPLFPGIPQLNIYPLIVSTAVSAIVFLFLINTIYERCRERTLAASLYALVRGTNETPPEGETLTKEAELQGIADAGFTQDEISVAMLLIEGETTREISRKLHLSAAATNQRINAIREKIGGDIGHDPVIDAVAAEYGLTKRETEMLRYLRDGGTTDIIAAELYISEDTVRFHVSNLLKKLGIEKRQDIIAWLSQRGQKMR